MSLLLGIHGSHIVLTLIIRLAGVDGAWLRQNLGISRPAAKLLSWQQAQQVSFCFFFVMNISAAKFEEHCYNISRDILYSVFHHFSSNSHDIIIQNASISKTKKDIPKRKTFFFI